MPTNPCSDIAPNGTSAEACPTKERFDYQFTDPSYNWRALRVINATDDFTFVQFGGQAKDFKNVSFSEFYNLKEDAWQMTNLWRSLPKGKQTALVSEMDHHYACGGTRTAISNCE